VGWGGGGGGKKSLPGEIKERGVKGALVLNPQGEKKKGEEIAEGSPPEKVRS